MSIVHSIVSIVVKKRIATTSRQGMSEWNTFNRGEDVSKRGLIFLMGYDILLSFTGQ